MNIEEGNAMMAQGSKSMAQRTEIPIFHGDNSHLLTALLVEMSEAEETDFREAIALLDMMSGRTVHALFAVWCMALQNGTIRPSWVN